jgi:ABC-type sugar transport system permease subunit
MTFSQDRIAAIVLILFGGSAYFVAQTSLPSRAGAMPSTVAILIAALAAVLLLRPSRNVGKEQENESFAASWPRLLQAVALTLLYFLVAVPLGFVTATFLFIVSNAFFAGYRNIRFLFASALVFSVTAKIVFGQILGLRLPEDLIVNLLLGAMA